MKGRLSVNSLLLVSSVELFSRSKNEVRTKREWNEKEARRKPGWINDQQIAVENHYRDLLRRDEWDEWDMMCSKADKPHSRKKIAQMQRTFETQAPRDHVLIYLCLKDILCMKTIFMIMACISAHLCVYLCISLDIFVHLCMSLYISVDNKRHHHSASSPPRQLSIDSVQLFHLKHYFMLSIIASWTLFHRKHYAIVSITGRLVQSCCSKTIITTNEQIKDQWFVKQMTATQL